MGRFRLYLYQTAAGVLVVQNKLDGILRREALAWSELKTGLRMLEEHGADQGLRRFTRLRHVEGDVELWELRTKAKPPYRALFAPVPNEDAFVVLDIIRKDEFASRSRLYIDRSLEFFDHWWNEVKNVQDDELPTSLGTDNV